MGTDVAEVPAILDGEVFDELIAIAERAPSVHNTQPWRFGMADGALELYADPDRRLPIMDADGREMLISCGAALFGLRLAVWQAGFRPEVELLPRWPRLDPLARVRLSTRATPGPGGRQLLNAVWRRHTHRGPFAREPLPVGLLSALRRDAEAESAALVLVDGHGLQALARLVRAAERHQARDAALAAEVRSWTSPDAARDGVSARAYVAHPTHSSHRLAPRDFDQGRGWGRLAAAGPAPPATAVLLTAGDGPADWVRAGQALHRLLLRAASKWVFASLHTQPLEIPSLRAAIRAQLGVVGLPQMVMQLGRAHTAALTGRRPTGSVRLPR